MRGDAGAEADVTVKAVTAAEAFASRSRRLSMVAASERSETKMRRLFSSSERSWKP